jgi:hypothetical protein
MILLKARSARAVTTVVIGVHVNLQGFGSVGLVATLNARNARATGHMEVLIGVRAGQGTFNALTLRRVLNITVPVTICISRFEMLPDWHVGLRVLTFRAPDTTVFAPLRLTHLLGTYWIAVLGGAGVVARAALGEVGVAHLVLGALGVVERGINRWEIDCVGALAVRAGGTGDEVYPIFRYIMWVTVIPSILTTILTEIVRVNPNARFFFSRSSIRRSIPLSIRVNVHDHTVRGQEALVTFTTSLVQTTLWGFTHNNQKVVRVQCGSAAAVVGLPIAPRALGALGSVRTEIALARVLLVLNKPFIETVLPKLPGEELAKILRTLVTFLSATVWPVLAAVEKIIRRLEHDQLENFCHCIPSGWGVGQGDIREDNVTERNRSACVVAEIVWRTGSTDAQLILNKSLRNQGRTEQGPSGIVVHAESTVANNALRVAGDILEALPRFAVGEEGVVLRVFLYPQIVTVENVGHFSVGARSLLLAFQSSIVLTDLDRLGANTVANVLTALAIAVVIPEFVSRFVATIVLGVTGRTALDPKIFGVRAVLAKATVSRD